MVRQRIACGAADKGMTGERVCLAELGVAADLLAFVLRVFGVFIVVVALLVELVSVMFL